MNPFNDENYYFQSQPYSYNPYSLPNYQTMQNKMKLKRTINIAIRSIATINQIVPIINQVKPLIYNTKNGIFIMKTLRHIDELNFDEIVDSIHPIDTNKDDVEEEIFENML